MKPVTHYHHPRQSCYSCILQVLLEIVVAMIMGVVVLVVVVVQNVMVTVVVVVGVISVSYGVMEVRVALVFTPSRHIRAVISFWVWRGNHNFLFWSQ